MSDRKLRSLSVAACIVFGAILVVLISAGCASTPYRESTGEYIDDSTITTKVKASFAGDKTVSAMRVNVETYKGVVQLSGFVDDKAEAQQATELAKNVRGVVRVENNIIVKPVGNAGESAGADAGHYEGSITGIDNDKHTITVKHLLISHTFDVATGAQIIVLNRKVAGLEDLRVGDEVKVTYSEQNGIKTAARVEQTAQK